MAAQTLAVSFTGANQTDPESFTLTGTTTDTVTITITFHAAGKLSDVQAFFPSGDTFAANLDLDGGGTHTDDIISSTSPPYVGLSGRAFQPGQVLVLSVTGGTSGNKGIAGQIEQHRAG